MLVNPEETKEALVQWIRDYFSQNGPSCSAVVVFQVVRIPQLWRPFVKKPLGQNA